MALLCIKPLEEGGDNFELRILNFELRIYDKELYKQTGAIDGYLYTDSDFGTIGDKLASGVAIP